MTPEPAIVLRQMAELTRQALAADSDTLEELEIPDEGLLLAAPEETQSGATPASLVFSIGAVVAASVLGPLGHPPAELEPYRRWREQLLERLQATWGQEGQEAVGVIGRCLQHDPFERPHPKHLVAELDPSWTPASRSRSYSFEPTLSRTPRLAPVRTEQRLSWMIVVVLTVALLLFVGANVGLALLFLSPAPAPPPPPLVVLDPVPHPALALPEPAPPPPEPVPAPVLPAPVLPAPVLPAPVLPTLGREPEVRNDLIDPWE